MTTLGRRMTYEAKHGIAGAVGIILLLVTTQGGLTATGTLAPGAETPTQSTTINHP